VQPRRLLLVRHAQAADGAADRDRPLTSSGEQRAAAIGSWLAQAGLVPDLVLVSPARRAAQTWELARASLPADVPSAVDERIYENTVEDLLAALQEAPGNVDTVALVGHNPSVGELARALDDGQGDPEATRALGAGFPTGGVAVFALAMPLTDIAPGEATLTGFTVPGA